MPPAAAPGNRASATACIGCRRRNTLSTRAGGRSGRRAEDQGRPRPAPDVRDRSPSPNPFPEPDRRLSAPRVPRTIVSISPRPPSPALPRLRRDRSPLPPFRARNGKLECNKTSAEIYHVQEGKFYPGGRTKLFLTKPALGLEKFIVLIKVLSPEISPVSWCVGTRRARSERLLADGDRDGNGRERKPSKGPRKVAMLVHRPQTEQGRS